MAGYPLDRVAGDDFDSEPPGNAPLNFTLSIAADTSVAVSNAASSSPPNSMRLTDNNTGGYARATKYFSASVNPTVRMSVKTPGERVEISILDSDYVARLYFREDGSFAYYDGAYKPVSSYSASGWNALAIVFDGTHKTYGVELNGVHVASGVPYYTSAERVNTIRISTGSAETAQGIFVDDIYVSE
jgi:hypothetical protein